MYCQADVIVRQLLLLLGVGIVWKDVHAEHNTTTTERSTDEVLTDLDDFSSPEYLLNASDQHPVNSSLDNWLKEVLQKVHYESNNETLSLNYTTEASILRHKTLLMDSPTNFFNKSDADFLHSIHRFKPHDLDKVLEIYYSPRYVEPNIFNKFSSYNLFQVLEAEEKKCTEDPERSENCACDPECQKYGDCCADSAYFNPQEQTLGSSRFKCTQTANGNAFTVDTCHSGWNDPFVRYSCEHPNKNYADPLRYIPVTSLRTNISYRNSHCAVCNNDYLHNDIELWPLVIRSTLNFHMLDDFEKPIRRLIYVSENSTWYLNLTGAYVNPSFFNLMKCPTEEEIVINYLEEVQRTRITYPKQHHIIESAPLVKCSLLPQIPQKEKVRDYIRPCQIGIDKCAENWQDISVKELCEAYYAPVTHCAKVYRNRHCVICNNWNPEIKSGCINVVPLEEYDSSWSFGQQMCEEFHVFDPVFMQCRLLFNPEEYRQESIQKPDSERRVILQKEEYLFSNDGSSVFVPAHNRLYSQYEFAVQGQHIILYLSQPIAGQYLPELNYVSATSICISIILLILHIVISIAIPESGLLEKNLRSFCFSLLLVYVSFIASGSMTLGSTSCMVAATLLYYTLLVSFFWMFFISLDTLRTIKQTIQVRNYLKAERRCTFSLYSLLSWLMPIAIVGLALAADFTHPDSSFAPGYGKPICWFNRASALIKFCLVPLALVLILNTVLISWSAYLILDAEETPVLYSMLREDFYFSARLIILSNLCWTMGIIATYINTHGEWYIFVILHALQGVYIFFASSFTHMEKKMIIL